MRPNCGGIEAILAYARACGIKKTPIVTPANTSLVIHFKLYLGNQDITGTLASRYFGATVGKASTARRPYFLTLRIVSSVSICCLILEKNAMLEFGGLAAIKKKECVARKKRSVERIYLRANEKPDIS